MKKYISRTFLIAGMSLSALASQNAHATTYTVDLDGPLGNSGAGYVMNYKTVYNTVNNSLDFSSLITERNHRLANGFWLVLNGGGLPGDATNPKGHVNEIAILYGDYSSQRLTAYIYNGHNDPSSLATHGAFIEPFTTEFTSTYTNGSGASDGVSTFDFSIGLDLINDPAGKPAGWRGIQYAEEVGIWYHPFFANNGAITYNNDGSINDFSTRYTGWFDTTRTRTTVPEPAGMGLMLFGFAGLAFYRRKKRVS